MQLVIKGREKFSDLNDHLYSMIELFLILREKCFADRDEEMTSLMHKEWYLYAFIQELIQALLPEKSFGGDKQQFPKEIMVSYRYGFVVSVISCASRNLILKASYQSYVSYIQANIRVIEVIDG